MKKIDDIGLKLCEYQGLIFEQSIDFFDCSSSYFIKLFMNSSLAFRLDKTSFIYEANDINAYLKELSDKYLMIRGNVKYPSYVMHWIGYLYRYFAYTYDLSSKEVYKIIKPNELLGLYGAYHAFDASEAIERIIESKNINLNPNILELAKKYYLS